MERNLDDDHPVKHMPDQEYKLTLNETQAQVMVDALDIYMRLGMGQLTEIAEHPDLRKRIFQTDDSMSMGPIRAVLKALKHVIFRDLGDNHYFSISSPEIGDCNRVANDIRQVIRHRLSWDRAGNPPERDNWTMFGPIYDPPKKYSNEPLPTIEAVNLNTP